MNTMFSLSEEAFLLSSLKEVVQVWTRGSGQAFFDLTVKDGKAELQLGFQLGSPSDNHLSPDQVELHPHYHGPQQEQDFQPVRHHKCSSRRKRDRNRAAQHQARTGTAAAGSSKQAATAPAVKLPFVGKILPIKAKENSVSVALAAPARTTSATKSPVSSSSSNMSLAPPSKPANPAGPSYTDASSVKKSLFPAGLPPGRPPSTTSVQKPRDYKQKEREMWSKLFKS